MTSQVAPLSFNVPIVYPPEHQWAQCPTPEFATNIQQWLKENVETAALAEGAVPGTRQIISGGGLTGGGDLSADRTLAVGAGTGITVNADDVAIDTTAEAERVRDAVAAFCVAGTNMTITHNDGADTLTFDASGGGGGAWTLADSWTHSVDVASVDFTGLAGANEILVIARGITLSSSGFRSVWVSVDNGATFYTTSGDYVTVASDGTETNTTSAGSHGTSSASARTSIVRILNAGSSSSPKHCRSNGFERLFVASSDNIDAVRVGGTAGNMTAGSIYIFTR